MPRLTLVAGFEWGSGFYINPTPPEDTAGYLRQARREQAPTVAEYLAFDKGHHVLAILTDMTNYCEALREVATSKGEVPSAAPSAFLASRVPGWKAANLAS